MTDSLNETIYFKNEKLLCNEVIHRGGNVNGEIV